MNERYDYCKCYGCEAYREGTMKVDIEDFSRVIKENCTKCYGEMYRSVLCYECYCGLERHESKKIDTCFDHGLINHGCRTTMFDPVTKPEHYNSHPSGIECIQITEHMNFCLGNAVKYIWRAHLKNGIEDVKKAQWCIKR